MTNVDGTAPWIDVAMMQTGELPTIGESSEPEPVQGKASTPRGSRRGLAASLPGTEAVDPPAQTRSGSASDNRQTARPKGKARVMAVANQKGGVGKTTTAINLGACLADEGHRVLIVDMDPQGNATTGLGLNVRNLDVSVYDVIMRDLPMDDCYEPTRFRNLFVAPAAISLAGAEVELVPLMSREFRLRRALEPITDEFDFILIDCPPSLGLLTVNALAAADEVLLPVQCEYYALEGVGQLLRNVDLVANSLNPTLGVSTVILTMYDARTNLAEQVAQEVRAYFKGRVCRSVVPRTVRLSEAPSHGEPIISYDPLSRGAIAYRELAEEVSHGSA